jgi:hypothetical protein
MWSILTFRAERDVDLLVGAVALQVTTHLHPTRSPTAVITDDAWNFGRSRSVWPLRQ